ncbi:CBS domain-containing protein [Methanocaldococcus fervens]|uniref:CBS domain containing membrane protein n=1 Tax=Methanocaldococcus fervens (strain DSM 4213 / JCM 15782 / AG86) TaxID=573064 RepID=C7P8X3_METFA|nr:CBS domain containing membrane protein [Methanocaldococcus fervens AG86]
MPGNIPVLLIMREPIIVSGDISVYDVAKLMVKDDMPSVLVIRGKPNKERIGVATDEDLINKVLIKKLPPDKVKIEDIASDKLVIIPPDTPIDEALRIMRDRGVKELFIVDEKGEIIGVITENDIMKVTPEIIATLKELVDYLLKIIDEVTEDNKKLPLKEKDKEKVKIKNKAKNEG